MELNNRTVKDMVIFHLDSGMGLFWAQFRTNRQFVKKTSWFFVEINPQTCTLHLDWFSEKVSIKKLSFVGWYLPVCTSACLTWGVYLRHHAEGLRGPEQSATSSYTSVCVLPSLTQMTCSNFYIKLATWVNCLEFSWLLLYCIIFYSSWTFG